MTNTDFIDFAGKIAATYSDAAACRSAISRAYYGAFHVVKSFLELCGIRSPRNANTHVFLQRSLLNSGVPLASEAGLLLADLFSDRLSADYQLAKRHVENVAYARTSVETAERIRIAIQSCDTDATRRQVAAGIADYERALAARRIQAN